MRKLPKMFSPRASAKSPHAIVPEHATKAPRYRPTMARFTSHIFFNPAPLSKLFSKPKVVDRKMTAVHTSIVPAACAIDKIVPTRHNATNVGTPSTAPRDILQAHHFEFTTHEQREIMQYDAIYYRGDKARPLGGDDKWDDDDGYYNVRVGGQLRYRYEIRGVLGAGSFGQVVRCQDHLHQIEVAIKIVRNRPKCTIQAYQEVETLRSIPRTSGIIHLLDTFSFRNHVCIVFYVAGKDLYTCLRTQGFTPFPISCIRKIVLSLVQSMVVLKRQGVIHCDLKAENVLLQGDQATLIDFGSSCRVGGNLYSYVQSRFYRAPEVMLGYVYDCSIDMWSLGCLVAELATGRVLFTGENEAEQVGCIMEVLGLPPTSMLKKCKSSQRSRYFDQVAVSDGDGVRFMPKKVVNAYGKVRRPSGKSWAATLAVADGDVADFIHKCIVWAPKDRMTPEMALEHPFLQA